VALLVTFAPVYLFRVNNSNSNLEAILELYSPEDVTRLQKALCYFKKSVSVFLIN